VCVIINPKLHTPPSTGIGLTLMSVQVWSRTLHPAFCLFQQTSHSCDSGSRVITATTWI